MSIYEVMYIVQPNLEDEALEEAVLKVKELIEREKGEVISFKKMGKRKLAYEIKDFKEGFYFVANVKAEANVVPALDHFFKVNEGYLRYIVIRLEGEEKRQLSEEEIVEEVREAESVQEEDGKSE